jgi:hypothetical protein
VIRSLLLLWGLALLVGGCRPLFSFNDFSGRTRAQRHMGLCERTVDRMIRCTTDPSFKGRLMLNRKRAAASCRSAGEKETRRCDKLDTCDAFLRCLAE